MSDVKLICNKSFSEADGEIVDTFIGFLEALVDKDFDKLNDVVMECQEFIDLTGKVLSKEEFISEIREDNLLFSVCDILDPTILFDDDNTASLIAKVRLTVKIKQKELRLITDSVLSFKKIDEKWKVTKWDS